MTFLKALKSISALDFVTEARTDTPYTLITIKEYYKFQGEQSNNTDTDADTALAVGADSGRTRDSHGTDTQRRTYKKVKELRKNSGRKTKPSRGDEKASPARGLFPDDDDISGGKPKKSKTPDEAYETYCLEFNEHRKIPYQRGQTKDFAQLAGLRERMGLEGRATPPQWLESIHNHFASVLTAYTLADLCSRYDVFFNGPIDRYNKPISTGENQDAFGGEAFDPARAERSDLGKARPPTDHRGYPRYVPKQGLRVASGSGEGGGA